MTDDANAPCFDAQGRLSAPRYDDVYFSVVDGLSETAHVFLRGNHLAPRFAAIDVRQRGGRFTIGETGFGTGLNFLACWRLFETQAMAGATLRFVSVEKQPLEADTIRRALEPWPELAAYRDRLLEAYETPAPGTHRIRLADGRVELVLLVAEAAEALAGWTEPVDAWFLDGFVPSRNPAMWSDEVFAQVGRLSGPGTTLATYTAAGFVRRGLAAAGFEIEKRPGFGTKRDMTAGRMPEAQRAPSGRAAESCDAVVIGAGVAGSFAARALADRGMRVTVLERQPLEAGQWPTLRPRVAMVQPKINDQSDPQGRFLREGFALVERALRERWGVDARVGWRPCGVFHAVTDEKSTKRLGRCLEQFETTGVYRRVDASQTQDELGVALPVGGLVVPSAGVLRPGGLCAALLDDPRIKVCPDTCATSLEHTGGAWAVHTQVGPVLRSPVVIVANAVDARRLGPTAHLPLEPVRGQASLIAANDIALPGTLRRALCFGGYLTPAIDGTHTLGASFIHDDDSTAWRLREHQALCDRLADILPRTAASIRQPDAPTGWVGFRCTTPKRRPFVGALPMDRREPDNPQTNPTGLFVSLGHGSHGITSAAVSAKHIAEAIT